MSKNRDRYAEITDTIVQALEDGVTPWVRPWKGAGPESAHRNGLSGHRYRGINIFLLNLSAAVNGFTSPEWFTYKSAKKAGGHVKQGESSTQVVFWKIIRVEDEDEETGEKERKTIPLLRHFNLFNRDQIEGLPEEPEVEPEESEAEPDAVQEFILAERVVKGSEAEISYVGGKACYVPDRDVIMLPEADRFVDRGAFYSTTFHELAHWTGHPTRLDRELSTRFGSEAYAMEELVAEMGSAFLGNVCEVEGTLQHPEYIGSWIKVLKDDKHAIFTAASQAQKAADYLLSLSGLDSEGEEKGAGEERQQTAA